MSTDQRPDGGGDHAEGHDDAISPGQRIIVIDDLLATGGTVAACVELTEAAGAEVVGSLFVIELIGLGGRERLAPTPVHALVEFPA